MLTLIVAIAASLLIGNTLVIFLLGVSSLAKNLRTVEGRVASLEARLEGLDIGNEAYRQLVQHDPDDRKNRTMWD